MNAHAPARALLCAACLLAAAGCVERTLEIRTEPPGARVFVDGRFRGTTARGPLVLPFDHYGARRVSARLPGRSPAGRTVRVAPPWYQIFPLDFFFECLFPFTLRDTNTVTLRLPALPPRGSEALARREKALARRAEEAREELARHDDTPAD